MDIVSWIGVAIACFIYANIGSIFGVEISRPNS